MRTICWVVLQLFVDLHTQEHFHLARPRGTEINNQKDTLTTRFIAKDKKQTATVTALSFILIKYVNKTRSWHFIVWNLHSLCENKFPRGRGRHFRLEFDGVGVAGFCTRGAGFEPELGERFPEITVVSVAWPWLLNNANGCSSDIRQPTTEHEPDDSSHQCRHCEATRPADTTHNCNAQARPRLPYAVTST
jgi:hypothetical protein